MGKILGFILGVFRKWRLFILKIRGKTPDDISDKRIVEGTAWSEFCDQLKAAGAALVYPGAPVDPFNQAEGLRYLTRLTRTALEAFVEYGDPRFPKLKRMVHETVKMGADNPDNYYLNAQIDGNFEYRIWGKRNSIDYIGFFTQNGNYGTTGGLAPCGVLENKDLLIDKDGSFEIILSNKRKGKNWLKTEPETSLVMVRQTFLDRENEIPSDLEIAIIGDPVKPEALTASDMDNRLKTAGLFVAGAPILFARWARGFKKHQNKLPLFDPVVSNAAGGDANIFYYHSYWKLEEGEALVIETQIPSCEMWNFQLNNYWMESLDYRYYNICINKASAVYEEDSSVRVIVSHENPGHPNWIETCGHHEGTMCWRWYRPESPNGLPEPQTKVVAFKDLHHE